MHACDYKLWVWSLVKTILQSSKSSKFASNLAQILGRKDFVFGLLNICCLTTKQYNVTQNILCMDIVIACFSNLQMLY